MHGNIRVRNGIGGSSGETGIINANGESLGTECEDLDNVSIVVVQATDAGTVTLVVEKTFDGTNWIAVGSSIAETAFAAGDGATIERTLSDSNGMPLVAKKVRVRATALAGGGVYSMHVAGRVRAGFAG